MATTLTVPQAVNNKIFVTPGQSIRLDVIVANSSPRPATGVNIGVKTDEAGLTNAGTLSLLPDPSSLRLDFSGELTHFSPRTMTGGTATFSFQWTAPESEGTVFLQAIANAVNRNGTPDPGDQWNFLQPIEIIVDNANSVQQTLVTHATSVFPLPASHSVVVEAASAAGESFDVRITDLLGAVIFTDRHTADSESIRYVWPSTTNNGVPANNGSYVVALTSDRRTIIGKAVIQR
jgi:hypothetical protein